MKKQNIAYESGYEMGYSYIKNEGGSLTNINQELKKRDKNYNKYKKTQWDIGFIQGACDAKHNLSCKYSKTE